MDTNMLTIKCEKIMMHVIGQGDISHTGEK